MAKIKDMAALEHLQQLDAEAKRARYTSIPIHAMPPSKFEDRTSNGLTRCIISFLQLKGCWATRINTTGRYLHKVDKWIPGTTRRGTADIHAVIAGRHVSIEVKIRDRMSEHQQKTKQAIEASGGMYYVARNFEEFLRWYNDTINME